MIYRNASKGAPRQQSPEVQISPTAEEMLTVARDAIDGADGSRASTSKYREIIAKLRPGPRLPGDPADALALARAHEGLADQYAATGQPVKAIESLYAVAVMSLLVDDPLMRGRAFAKVADLRISAGNYAEARKDLTTAALAFDAAGDGATARELRERRSGRTSATGVGAGAGEGAEASGGGGSSSGANANVGTVPNDAPRRRRGLADRLMNRALATLGTNGGADAPSGRGDVVDGEVAGTDEGGTGSRVDWGKALVRVESAGVSDAKKDGADALLRLLLNSAGQADGPNDDQIRRAAPLLVGMGGAGRFDASAFAADITVAANAVCAIDDLKVQGTTRDELAERSRAVWTSALTTGDEALRAGDAATARDAFQFVLDSRSKTVHATSAQQGAALVGRTRAAVISGDQKDIRSSALAGANAVCRLPDTGDRARYGERFAHVLRDVGDATTLRMRLLERVADNWSQVGDEHAAVRCLLEAALCKAKLRDFRSAHADFQRLSQRAEELEDTALLSESLLHLGRSWNFAGRPEVAVKCYDTLLDKVTPGELDDDRARVGYARLLLEKGRTLARVPGASESELTEARAGVTKARDIFAGLGAQLLVREANETIDQLPR
ncbi:hypothetical protein [Corynebacterium freneyi]|uniref:hypothetical protein n=1 Tax=Corynebacterium freneyi TaxID=134034 RepID=UPI001CCEB378|nr:hypothetical protein [Corynebacterium freneyi]UBI02668.1 hypothetical protein LA334_02170 [Corynebacterium freneyi]